MRGQEGEDVERSGTWEPCLEDNGSTAIPGVEERAGHDACTQPETPPGPSGLTD